METTKQTTKRRGANDPFSLRKTFSGVQYPKIPTARSIFFLSQRYALEDRILKQMPYEIRATEERIAGYQSDIELLRQHVSEEFPGMTIQGTTYPEKKDAGAAILAACKAKTKPTPEPIGFYRGFELRLEYDVLAKQFRLNIKGKLSHFIDLGTDANGNIQRIENCFGSFEERLHANEQSLITQREQLETAKAEAAKPFPQEDELRAKSARLAELDSMLNMDKRDDGPVLDLEPDTDDGNPPCPVQEEAR